MMPFALVDGAMLLLLLIMLLSVSHHLLLLCYHERRCRLRDAITPHTPRLIRLRRYVARAAMPPRRRWR